MPRPKVQGSKGLIWVTYPETQSIEGNNGKNSRQESGRILFKVQDMVLVSFFCV